MTELTEFRDDAHHREVRETLVLFFEVAGAMRHHFETVAQRVGLTPQQARALRALDEPVPMGEVAERLHCDPSNVTGIVDRLAAAGLVTREPDPADRRRVRLVITTAGLDLRERFHDELMRGRPGITALDRDDLATLRELLVRSLDR